jgi:hypothetical protein
LSRWKKITLVAAVVATIQEAGLRNVLASTFLTIAGPVTATAFVYEIQAMRHDQLAREAADRAAYAARLAAEANDPAAPRPMAIPVALSPADTAPDDIAVKLDVMLKSRAVILDTFGDEASAVAPVYASIIKQMLREDEDTLATVAARSQSAASDETGKLGDRVARLRAMHQKLIHLAGA